MKQFCIIQDGIPKVMELLKPAFPLIRELDLAETFLHVELSPGYDERLMFNRKYYLVKWKETDQKIVGSTDAIEAIIEELKDEFSIKLDRAISMAKSTRKRKDNKTEVDADPEIKWLPALECAAPVEEYPKEEVEYQPIYVKVKEVEGIKFKSLEFNYSSDEFYPTEEYNAEECGTVIVACIRWKTDVKELVKELNDNGCRSITRELWDGRPPMRLNDEFAKYAEMEYNRGYKVTLVLEEPTEKEQATLLELRSKADKAINKVFGGK